MLSGSVETPAHDRPNPPGSGVRMRAGRGWVVTAHWREADVKRALAAAEKARIRSYRVDITPDGTISIVVGAAAKSPTRGNSCDDLLS